MKDAILLAALIAGLLYAATVMADEPAKPGKPDAGHSGFDKDNPKAGCKGPKEGGKPPLPKDGVKPPKKSDKEGPHAKPFGGRPPFAAKPPRPVRR